MHIHTFSDTNLADNCLPGNFRPPGQIVWSAGPQFLADQIYCDSPPILPFMHILCMFISFIIIICMIETAVSFAAGIGTRQH